MKKILAILILALSLTALPALAGGYYAIGNVSVTNVEMTDVTSDNPIGLGFGVGRDIYAGLLAVELTYDYLGKGDAFANGTTLGFDATALDLNLVFSPTMTVIGSMPLKLVLSGGVSSSNVNIDLYRGARVKAGFNDKAFTAGAGVTLGLFKHTDVMLGVRHRDLKNFGIQMNTVAVTFKHRF